MKYIVLIILVFMCCCETFVRSEEEMQENYCMQYSRQWVNDSYEDPEIYGVVYNSHSEWINPGDYEFNESFTVWCEVFFKVENEYRVGFCQLWYCEESIN